MSIPIVFVHQGFAEHLWIATRQARLSNPSSPIVLLGDEANRNLKWISDHVSICDYVRSAKRFASIYTHRSSNSIGFELFCFQRWFVLLDWMTRQGLESVWCLDSDIMLYSDMDTLAAQYGDVDLVQCGGSGHSLLIRNRKGLEDYCDYVGRMYTDTAIDRRMAEEYQAIASRGGSGGISDMIAFADLAKQRPDRVANSADPWSHGMMDIGMHLTADYEGDHHKTIHWKGGYPYASRRDNGHEVRFHSLHFQGGNKRLMASYAWQPDFSLWAMWLRRRTVGRMQRLRQSFRKRLHAA